MPYKHAWLGLLFGLILSGLYYVTLQFLGANAFSLALPLVLGGIAFLTSIFAFKPWILHRLAQHNSHYDCNFTRVMQSLERSDLHHDVPASTRNKYLYPHLFPVALTLHVMRWGGLGLVLIGSYAAMTR